MAVNASPELLIITIITQQLINIQGASTAEEARIGGSRRALAGNPCIVTLCALTGAVSDEGPSEMAIDAGMEMSRSPADMGRAATKPRSPVWGSV